MKYYTMFLIPILIILAVVAATYGDNVIKGIDFSSLFKLNLGLAPKTQAPEKTQTQPTASYRQGIQPRAPPAPPRTQPQAKPSVSSYLQKVRISSLQKAEGTNPFRLTLYASLGDQTAIDITGWRLKGNFVGEFVIGKGIEKYHPSFNSQPTENILVKRSDTIYISGGQSPLGRNVHFRTNKCFGYLKVYTPSLPGTSSCHQDRPTLEQIKNLTPSCQDFILNKINFSSCAVPDLGPVATNQECVAYINNTASGFNYPGCYAKRQGEPDFLSNEWYIYADTQLGHFLHDTITLLDQNGLVVDTYTY